MTPRSKSLSTFCQISKPASSKNPYPDGPDIIMTCEPADVTINIEAAELLRQLVAILIY